MLCYFYASTFLTRVIIKSCFMVVCTLIVCVDNRKLYDTIITTYMININQVEIIFHGLMGSYTSPCFFRFNLKTKHVDFIHSFACQCHVYYIKYYNATCSAVNTHLFKTALNLLGEIS